jgi:putative sterol carrier protein
MIPKFPSDEWLQKFHEKLNSDEHYGTIAKKWEGDISVVLEPNHRLKERLIYYFDLWHGKCKRVAVLDSVEDENSAFIITSTYDNFTSLLEGKLDPVQAMLTRKLKVKGNMAVMMRNVPVVLDFVRCAREVTDEIQ